MSTREEALKISSFVGCSGAHQDKDGDWMPCSSPEILQRLSMEAEPKKKAAIHEYESVQRMSQKRRGKRKMTGSKFEKLRERGVAGISTAPDGSLSSMTAGSSGALF